MTSSRFIDFSSIYKIPILWVVTSVYLTCLGLVLNACGWWCKVGVWCFLKTKLLIYQLLIGPTCVKKWPHTKSKECLSEKSVWPICIMAYLHDCSQTEKLKIAKMIRNKIMLIITLKMPSVLGLYCFFLASYTGF